MSIDLSAAASFMAGHARLLDRRRFRLITEDAGAAHVLAALDAYRNADGGYGWGLEPDLRSPESQPGAALHAFEAFEEAAAHAPVTTRAVALCDWLESVTLPDGGLPFALPLTSRAATAPWWAGADPNTSSLQITAVTAALAHHVAARVPAVAGHPWLDRATAYCLAAIEAIDETPHAYVLAFAVRFLDAVHDLRPEAPGLLASLGTRIPPSGEMPVEGGIAGETLRPLNFTESLDRPAGALFRPEVIEADLDRLAGLQQEDGGWIVDHASSSPAGALEWRGHATVRAIGLLRRHGRLRKRFSFPL
ncbi:hypothetical protein [Actinoallomurus sp. NPDC050550]|uniref:hypothetical protein n=1 Tax=Actinoallomurus sp. NPDC050550 TaxID=3154937 RepID=UPI0033FEEBAD